ncbi:hypothetical protein ES702_02218 [subsurface metagenome]
MQENLKHREAAFEYYYGLGSDRSLSKVARQFKVSETNIKEWSTPISLAGSDTCKR